MDAIIPTAGDVQFETCWYLLCLNRDLSEYYQSTGYT